jgi:aminomuconate-semialdehyde/2-hydroxymuconate-6-semialdehyde dehydrogenase
MSGALPEIPHFIGGELVPAASGSWLDDVEPATGRVYARVADGDAEDVERAVAAAEAAFPAWSQRPAAERSRLLLEIARRIEDDLEAFARAESVDTGKPIAAARTVDIPRAVANLRFFATAILHERSDLHPMDRTALSYTLRRPRGVAGLISPWNLPLYLLTWKVAPALAAGCTAVAKPSEVTPMTAHLLARACAEAGLPPGVLNVVHGLGGKVGAALVAHPRVPTVSFTGGTGTGRAIAAAGAASFKKLALEMGGKNPFVVFADAPLDEAAESAVRAGFGNQGQICLCGSRLLVERTALEPFLERFVPRVRALRLGDPMDEATEQGALVSAAHRDKVLSYLDLARREGGQVLTGGGPAEAPNARCAEGYFVQPTVVAGLAPTCRTNLEEIFGPVVTVLPFEDEDEAVAIANGTEYGLAASVYTRDVSRAHRVADRIACGIVWVNCWMLRDLRVPFGGMKASGVGREGGEEALRFFTEPKSVTLKL